MAWIYPILGQGVPHPRTYGSTARVLGHYARDRGIVTLEAAVAKAQRRSGGARRAPRPRRASGRAPSPMSWCSTPRPWPTSDLRPAGGPTGGDPGRDRERPSGGARWSRDRRAPRADSSGAATEASVGREAVRRPGRRRDRYVSRACPADLPYVLRRSPGPAAAGRRSLPDRGVVVSIPPAAPRGWARPERSSWSSSPSARPGSAPPRPPAGRARSPGSPPPLDDGRTRPDLRVPHRVRVVAAPPGHPAALACQPGRRREGDELVVERVHVTAVPTRRDPRGLVPRPRPRGPHAGDRPSRSARSASARPGSPSATRPAGGGAARARATCRSRGGSSSLRPRRSTPSRRTSCATCACSAMGRVPAARRARPGPRRVAPLAPPPRAGAPRGPRLIARPRGGLRRSAMRTWTNVARFCRPAREPFRCAHASYQCPRLRRPSPRSPEVPLDPATRAPPRRHDRPLRRRRLRRVERRALTANRRDSRRPDLFRRPSPPRRSLPPPPHRPRRPPTRATSTATCTRSSRSRRSTLRPCASPSTIRRPGLEARHRRQRRPPVRPPRGRGGDERHRTRRHCPGSSRGHGASPPRMPGNARKRLFERVVPRAELVDREGGQRQSGAARGPRGGAADHRSGTARRLARVRDGSGWCRRCRPR